MSDLNPWAVVVATVASFLASGGWYALMGSRLARLNAAYAQDVRHPGATAAVELGRGLLVGIGVSTLVGWTGTEDVLPLLGLAALLVVTFPAVLLWGSVWHEKVRQHLPASMPATGCASWSPSPSSSASGIRGPDCRQRHGQVS